MVPSSEMLVEAVPEALKNMLLVLASRDVLKAGWADPADSSIDLWVPGLLCSAELAVCAVPVSQDRVEAGSPIFYK
jgi:hypothetical protein